MRSETEIIEELDRAQDLMLEPSKWPGMTYEQGVAYALDWALGNTEEKPMDDD